ncbi:hypothetical protein HBA97_09420 [Mycobacteroides chelonae]|uniref:Lipoprotein n=2 Tax=Mycobacteroides chelonae TaxID=1774 RepID=A0A1S1MEE7_MYCCH|nr:hypothetical protein BKG84_02530 [Mycobacteroides chelonae]QQG90269.1 hypothetical protein HBA99_09420 [Mycobacteroides chelonae]QQG95086.1 hypothetical protein HBA97_09420 [Mycobacteroides chelonae]
MVCRFLRHQSACTATVFTLIGVCVLSACGQTPDEMLADELNGIYREVAQAVQNHNIDAYNALTCARQHLDGIDSIKSGSAADLPTTSALTEVSVHGDAALATLATPPEIARELAEGYRVAFLKENEGWKYCGGTVAVGIASARSSGRQ